MKTLLRRELLRREARRARGVGVDGVVLVVHWRRTIDRVIRTAIRQLPARAIRHMGVVLNHVDMKKQVRFGGNDAASFYEKYRGYYA